MVHFSLVLFVVVSQEVSSFLLIYFSQFVFNEVCVVPSVLEVALKIFTVAYVVIVTRTYSLYSYTESVWYRFLSTLRVR